jgi:hypothetical protein
MASTAIGSELTRMGIVAGMAVKAFMGGALQVCDAERASMAHAAGSALVGSGQCKCRPVVVKVISVTVDPIVAGQATRPKAAYMVCHRLRVYFLVAVCTQSQVHCLDFASVAVGAGEALS